MLYLIKGRAGSGKTRLLRQKIQETLNDKIKALKNELFEKDIEKIKNRYAFESTIVDLANGKDFLHTNYVHTFAELINKYGYDLVMEKLTELAHAHTPQEEPVGSEIDDDLPFEIDTD